MLRQVVVSLVLSLHLVCGYPLLAAGLMFLEFFAGGMPNYRSLVTLRWKRGAPLVLADEEAEEGAVVLVEGYTMGCSASLLVLAPEWEQSTSGDFGPPCPSQVQTYLHSSAAGEPNLSLRKVR